jgi:hypothetical protein
MSVECSCIKTNAAGVLSCIVLPGGERPENFLYGSRENPADDLCLLLLLRSP